VRSAVLAFALALLLAAAPARADIFAVAPVFRSAANSIDVGLLDLSTGASLTLPAGVNTPAFENHPSITPDGKFLAFERVDQAAGTDRILITDLTTGQTRDLVDTFSSLTYHLTSPAIYPDGEDVALGSNGTGLWTWGGPGSFSHEDIFPGFKLVDPTARANANDEFAYRRIVPQSGGGTIGQIVAEQVLNAPGPVAINSSAFDAQHPALTPSGAHAMLLYDVQPVASTARRDIGYCVLYYHGGDPCSLGRGVLPAIVNSAREESRPAWTPDGRYIGFIRDETNGHERVYVFDTETQTLIDPDGTDLGPVATIDTGNLSLYEKPVLRVTNLPSFGTLVVNPVSPVPIGLLVQRVVGHHRLLGRRVPTLKPAGRIPLGRFSAGRHVIHWHAHLRPGQYQFTPRALSRSGRIRDLGTPRIFRVR
jgi:hypothetical protein